MLEGIVTDSEIIKEKKEKLEYPIWIKCINGKTYKVFVDEMDTLKDIKKFMAPAIKPLVSQ